MSAAYANSRQYGNSNGSGVGGYDGPMYTPPVARGVPSSLNSSINTLDTKVTDEDISRQFEEERINKLKDQRAEVQKKVFTRWMNSHLKQKNRNCQVVNLFADITDGKCLMELMSCLINEPMQPNPGVLRVQKVENVNRCLEKIEDQLGDKLVNIGAVDIVDGNRIAILGLMWTIILRFNVQAAVEEPGEVADLHKELGNQEKITSQRYRGADQEGGYPGSNSLENSLGSGGMTETMSYSRPRPPGESGYNRGNPLGDTLTRGPNGESIGRGPNGEYIGRGPMGDAAGLSPMSESFGRGPYGPGSGRGPSGEQSGRGPMGGDPYNRGPSGDAGGRGPSWNNSRQQQGRRVDGGVPLNAEKQKELQRIEEALLLWAKSKCAKYGIDVQNFSTSWRDGQAFCALIHSQCGDDAIDMSQVRPSANRENLDYAFTAAQQLGVDRLLEPEDVDVRLPDSRLILTYVTHLYHNLAKKQVEQIGGRRLAKIVSTLLKVDNMKSQYMDDVHGLRSWLRDTESWLNSRDFPTDTSELQRCLTVFKEKYLAIEKPQKMNERDQTEAELVVIHTTLAALNMPRWMPPSGATLSDIGGDWDRLLEAEHNRQTALHAALQQSERLDLMAAQFTKRADMRDVWLNDISGRLAAERTPLDDRSAESLLKRYEALATEIFGM